MTIHIGQRLINDLVVQGLGDRSEGRTHQTRHLDFIAQLFETAHGYVALGFVIPDHSFNLDLLASELHSTGRVDFVDSQFGSLHLHGADRRGRPSQAKHKAKLDLVRCLSQPGSLQPQGLRSQVSGRQIKWSLCSSRLSLLPINHLWASSESFWLKGSDVHTGQTADNQTAVLMLRRPSCLPDGPKDLFRVGRQ